MADSYNTSDPSPSQPPNYPSPIPGAKNRVTWPDYLELMAVVVDQIDSMPIEETRSDGVSPGHFVGNYLLGLSKQARLMGCTSPSDHLTKAEAAACRADAYVAALEQAVEHCVTWELGPDPDLGSWGGHPDEATLQAHIAIDPESETWRN